MAGRGRLRGLAERVFVNNQIDLSKISIFGFDYDYTLAEYKGKAFLCIKSSTVVPGVSTCPLNLVGSAGQVRAVFGQSDFSENWAVLGQFFEHFFKVDFYLK